MAGNYAGGGGAGGVGGNVNGSSGGSGAPCSITGASTYYAGGGAPNGNPGLGGQGGGGDGAHNTLASTPASPGVNGLGGGGGGGWGDAAGGAGGSGVVILAYLPGLTTYTVSFDSNGGSSVASEEVPSGGKAAAATGPDQERLHVCPLVFRQRPDDRLRFRQHHHHLGHDNLRVKQASILAEGRVILNLAFNAPLFYEHFFLLFAFLFSLQFLHYEVLHSFYHKQPQKGNMSCPKNLMLTQILQKMLYIRVF